MSVIFHLVQNEKADALQLRDNVYTLVQLTGDQANKIIVHKFISKEGFNVLGVTSVKLPSKTKIRGGRNKVVKTRPKKFLVRIAKGQILKTNETSII